MNINNSILKRILCSVYIWHNYLNVFHSLVIITGFTAGVENLRIGTEAKPKVSRNIGWGVAHILK